MKKIFIFFLSFSLYINVHQPVNAMKRHHNPINSQKQEAEDNKKDHIEIDMSNYMDTAPFNLESEFLLPPGHIERGDGHEFDNLMKPVTTTAKKIGNKIMPVLPYVIPATLFLGYQWYSSDPEIGFSIAEAVSTGFQGLGGSFLAANLFSTQIQTGLSTLRQKFLPISWQSGDFAKILKYKKRIDERFTNNQITENTKSKFYTAFNQYTYLAKFGAETIQQGEEHVKTMKLISKLPVVVKMLDYNNIKPKLDALLETYREDTKDSIKKVIKEIVLASNSRKPKKTIICFYGPSGTGKTHLAQEIAKLLELSMTHFKPSSSKAKDMIAQYIGPDGQELMLNLFTHKKNNYKNNILFIDEFDCCLKESYKHKDAFRDFFVSVCEKEQEFYESGKIQGLDIDMSSTIIIMAGNKIPEDKAILDRIRIINFTDVPKDKQDVIAVNSFNDGLYNYRMEHQITPEDTEILGQIVLKNNLPGVRVLKDIVDKYVTHLAGCYYLLDEDQINPFDVNVAYQDYERENEESKKKSKKKDDKVDEDKERAEIKDKKFNKIEVTDDDLC
ncbi:MAG: ATP-binding protein [Alphaproteobacteria bacterium]|nr:ATP-binding protein [Alphaproteobacteria bacterium]